MTCSRAALEVGEERSGRDRLTVLPVLRSALGGAMYVCNCNGLTRACVSEAISAGAAEPAAIYAHHGCRMRCGRCLPDLAGHLVDYALQSRTQAGLLIAAE